MDSELLEKIKKLENWHEQDEKLHAEFKFTDFNEAFAFMTRVAMLAEKMQHHPDMSNFYNVVQITLWTHKYKTIRPKDVEMAEEIDKLR
ncbi:MAG TPA: 4a-hydroxytetrahydrobiopterin dehydratase [Candidatus Dormibacteraeota bacterium]|nr:4a-hydroxytetrahydrobiopterin dehydratase [Candidatus Dormibacteraeota bacterium]